MKAEVTAIEHADVREKKQLYLKISNGEETFVINIGKQTFDKINAMGEAQKQEHIDKVFAVVKGLGSPKTEEEAGVRAGDKVETVTAKAPAKK